jgi:hypothetical protein
MRDLTAYLNNYENKFQIARNGFYVDKSNLIAFLNSRIDTEKRFLCVSRPRGFGKTMAADMLQAYYQIGAQTETLFSDLKIASHPSFNEHFNKHNVVFINALNALVEASYNANKMIEQLEATIMGEVIKLNPNLPLPADYSVYEALRAVKAATKTGFIFIIDEWDGILRDDRFDEQDRADYLEFLRALLKDKEYVALAYMTGILPIKKNRNPLNMFSEYSMLFPSKMSEFTGFTEPEVQMACEDQNMDLEKMKEWYEGYCLNGERVFCPYSVSESISAKKYASHWPKTGAHQELEDYISMDFDGLKDKVNSMYAGNKVAVNASSFQNDIFDLKSTDEVLTLLVHLGYLGYDDETGEVFIPTKEVKTQFDSLLSAPAWT